MPNGLDRSTRNNNNNILYIGHQKKSIINYQSRHFILQHHGVFTTRTEIFWAQQLNNDTLEQHWKNLKKKKFAKLKA